MSDAAQLRPLLPGRPGCAVLATGRRTLGGLAGAASVRLAPLTPAESVELLGRLVGHERVSHEADAADDVGASLGGLPLALRIVGVRLATRPHMPLARFARRLRDERRRLDELAVDDLAVRSSFELSYAALDPQAQTAFRRLGLLGAGDFAAWTAGVLAGGDGDRLVERLLEASLLLPAGVDVTGEPRYRLHDLLAVYARELLRRDDPAHIRAALRAHLDTLLVIADRCWAGSSWSIDDLPPMPLPGGVTCGLPADELAALSGDPVSWFVAERAHLVAALERACEHGWLAEAYALAQRAIPTLDVFIGRERVAALHEMIRDAASKGGEELLAWRSEYNRSAGLIGLGRLAEAAEGLEECAAAFERLGATMELAYTLGALAFCYATRGAAQAALPLAEAAVRAAVASGALPAQASTIRELADVLSLVDRRARELVDDREDPYGGAWLANLMARVAVAEGRHADAVRLARDARERFVKLGDRRGEHLSAAFEATALLALGRPGEAVELMEPALEALSDLGVTRLEGQFRATLEAARRAL